MDRAANSFEVIAREWFEARKPNWAPSHSTRLIKRLENDVFPWIGGRPIAEITAPEILAVMRRIEGRGTLDTAHRAHQDCGQVFRYAVATGRAERDPTGDLRGALPTATGGHFAAITDPTSVGELLRAIDGFKGTFIGEPHRGGREAGCRGGNEQRSASRRRQTAGRAGDQRHLARSARINSLSKANRHSRCPGWGARHNRPLPEPAGRAAVGHQAKPCAATGLLWVMRGYVQSLAIYPCPAGCS
jgi:hypothetical protein